MPFFTFRFLGDACYERQENIADLALLGAFSQIKTTAINKAIRGIKESGKIAL